MFDDIQKAALAAPLNKANVKRNPRGYDYVEGWHAINEANRIFGFDAWTRETVEVRCIAEGPREVGKDKAKGFGVSYLAKVRVTAGGVFRDGYGAGHGIDRDLGLAHESALKEAETDAMKRALMTFGYPFGLALYDKTQEHVVIGPSPAEAEASAYVLASIEEMKRIASAGKLKEWWKAEAKNRQLHFTTADDPLLLNLHKAFVARGTALAAAVQQAAA